MIRLLLIASVFAIASCKIQPRPESNRSRGNPALSDEIEFPSVERLKDFHGGDYELFETSDRKVNIVGRATTGMRSPVPNKYTRYDFESLSRLRGIYDTLTIHHSAGPGDEDVCKIQDFHIDGRGWADIGYHFLIDENGVIYEGRPVGVQGAHAENFNQGNLGICLLGNFVDAERVPEKQLASLWQLARAVNLMLRFERVRGHREFKSTDCPSDLLMEEVESLRGEFHLPG